MKHYNYGFDNTIDIEFGSPEVTAHSKIALNDVSIPFGITKLVLSERLTKHKIIIEMGGGVRTPTVNGELRSGERLALIYDEDQYKYVVIDLVINVINYYD